MSQAATAFRTVRGPRRLTSASHDDLTVFPLTDEHESEALAFLAPRSFQTFYMTSLIRDNGLVSSFNRGAFYGYRNGFGRLTGVALIGHATLIETNDEAALDAFARLAQKHQFTHFIAGEPEKVECLWKLYSQAGRSARFVNREFLFEQKRPDMSSEPLRDLRLARAEDLDLIVPVQAELAFEESGTNPLESDPEGFRLRCARRIEQGRIWVWVEKGELMFKADVMADTPEVVYLEGVYVAPGARGKGYGSRCMAQLSRTILSRTRSIYVLVNERNAVSQAFFSKIGYRCEGRYETIYLKPQ